MRTANKTSLSTSCLARWHFTPCAGRTELHAGMCAGFKAGSGDAHHLVNETSSDAVYLEAGDRTPGDEVTYPDDDLVARFADGSWHFFHKDGRPYP